MYAGGNDIDAVAWYDENSGGHTHPVGLLAPNGFGLFDMCGNVWEWCRDTFKADIYRLNRRENPEWMEPGPDRVIRGGSWNLNAWEARCSRRFSYPVDFYGPGLGFRLVIIP